MSDRLKRLTLPKEIPAHHGDVLTAYRVKSHDQYSFVRHADPFPRGI
jgi:hypothetical protein